MQGSACKKGPKFREGVGFAPHRGRATGECRPKHPSGSNNIILELIGKGSLLEPWRTILKVGVVLEICQKSARILAENLLGSCPRIC